MSERRPLVQAPSSLINLFFVCAQSRKCELATLITKAPEQQYKHTCLHVVERRRGEGIDCARTHAQARTRTRVDRLCWHACETSNCTQSRTRTQLHPHAYAQGYRPV
eukprot:6195738-Pleurochrysis_carterae.AAC.1